MCMDMMTIRKMVMGQMASGANFVKGTYAVPSSGTTKIEFGKTFNRYMYFIELTDDSKTALLNSGENGNRTFAICGIYPMPSANDESPSYCGFTYRINPTTGAQSASSTNSVISVIDESSITFPRASFSGGVNYLYTNCTYNYFIVEIK